MRTFLGRLRAVTSLALIWGAVWLPVGAVVDLLHRWMNGLRLAPLFLWDLGVWTIFGGLSGAIFAVLLALLERRQSFHQLSAQRGALWGAAAGAALPICLALILAAIGGRLAASPFAFAGIALLGSVCGWGTLKIARHGVGSESDAAARDERQADTRQHNRRA